MLEKTTKSSPKNSFIKGKKYSDNWFSLSIILFALGLLLALIVLVVLPLLV